MVKYDKIEFYNMNALIKEEIKVRFESSSHGYQTMDLWL